MDPLRWAKLRAKFYRDNPELLHETPLERTLRNLKTAGQLDTPLGRAAIERARHETERELSQRRRARCPR